MPVSPLPSAYGVSPTTTMPALYPVGTAVALTLYVTLAAPISFSIAFRIVVPPETTLVLGVEVLSLPDAPCQLTVQPPVWLPMLSALLPAR